MNKDVEKIKWHATIFGVEDVSAVILDDPRFSIWWGGLKTQHHDFNGGLAKNTLEVIELTQTCTEILPVELDGTELFLSALFHDVGKMYDYTPNTDTILPDGTITEFKSTPHKRLIHHISRSALMWSHAITPYEELYEQYHDKVLHNILSHHGQREWGSPVSPKTSEAWMLHLCDGISARMNDYNKIDLVVNNNPVKL